MANAKPRITYSDKNGATLGELTVALNLSKSEAVDWLIENSHRIAKMDSGTTPELKQYSVAEQKEINDAVANSGLTIEAIAREGTLQRARYLNSIAESQAKLESMSTDDVKKATFKGVSRHRISQAVEKIREHND